MRRLPRDAFQHFSHDIGRAVDKLFHGDGFRTGERGSAGPAWAPDGLACCGGSCGRAVAGYTRRTLRATIHQVRTSMHGTRRDRAGAGQRRAPISGYFIAAISFARISCARSTLRLMPSSRAAWIWLRWLKPGSDVCLSHFTLFCSIAGKGLAVKKLGSRSANGSPERNSQRVRRHFSTPGMQSVPRAERPDAPVQMSSPRTGRCGRETNLSNVTSA